MSRILLAASISAFVAIPALTHAQTPESEASTKADVVVTASRVEQPVEKTMASVTVLDRKDIERSNAPTLPDLLRRQAGIQYVASGGRGSTNSLFMRGTNSGHVLVLVDGVRVGSATLGSASLENYSVDQIERIEIVRGPRSSIYGSEAIGGVIQIFTKKSAEPIRVSIGAGSDQTLDHAVTLSGATDKTRHALTLTYEESQGFDSSTKDDALVDGRFNFDDDAYRNIGTNLNFSHLLTDRISVDGLYLNNEGENEFDPGSYGPDGTPYTDVDNTVASLGATVDLSPLELKTQLSRSEDNSATFGSRENFINSNKDQGLFQIGINNETLGTLVGGLEYVDESVESTELYTQTERAVFSGFLQAQKELGGVTMQLGGRHDDNEQFGSKKTGNVGLGVAAGKSVQLYTTYGTAFKAPTFNDLYWPADDFSAGNPDLKPEASHTAEVGGKWFGQQQSIDVSVYKTVVKDLILWQANADFFYAPINVDDVQIKGMEVTYGAVVDRWVVDTQFALTHARDEATDQPLIRRADRTLATSADYNFAPFSVGATWFVSSAREDSAFNDMGEAYRVRLGGYSTLDIRASYQVTQALQLKGSVENVFDREYVLADGYNIAGLGGMLHVIYVPQ